MKHARSVFFFFFFSFLYNRGSLTNERVGLPNTCLRRLYREKTPPETAEKEKEADQKKTR